MNLPIAEEKTIEEVVQSILKEVCRGLGNIHCMAPDETTLQDCMNVILNDEDKAHTFSNTFGFDPELVLNILPYAPGLRISDLVIKRMHDGEEDPSTRMLSYGGVSASSFSFFD